MRLLLHIGMPKTGTSTLQRTLLAHRRRLSRVGVLYPRPARREANHNRIVAPFFEADDMHRALLHGRPNGASAQKLGTHVWNDIRREVAGSDASTTILSGELFYGLREDRLRRLAALLREVFDPIDVVCYVREPAAYYVSLAQQLVRGTARITPPARFRMRTSRCLPRFHAAFDDRVTVRAFEPTALVDGDIVTDFVTAVLPEARAALPRQQRIRANESISAEAMCVLQQRRLAAGGPDRLTRRAARTVERLRGLTDAPRTPPRLRPDLEAALVRRHAAELAWLREHHGIEFSTIAEPAAADEPPPAGWETEDLRRLLDVDPAAVETVAAALGRRERRRRWPGRRQGS